MIQIGQKLSPTFQQPLELLSDCHRRVESFLHALIVVAEQSRGGELNELQRDALETALRYFREAAPKHTADEEESLFPRMRKLAGDATREALAKIQALEADHQIAKWSHHAVEQLGQKWLVNERLSSEETSNLVSHLGKLQSIYEGHIAIEDNEIFPLAAKVLDAATLKDVGREMAERRGQDFASQIRFRKTNPEADSP
ncbi:MAG: Hemerythrin cation binding domain protein [Verrucomicrobiales bacterium]|nr:Hemerythrin cation binding domain protein [Verrucomicrobiales bacterium]